MGQFNEKEFVDGVVMQLMFLQRWCDSVWAGEREGGAREFSRTLWVSEEEIKRRLPPELQQHWAETKNRIEANFKESQGKPHPHASKYWEEHDDYPNSYVSKCEGYLAKQDPVYGYYTLHRRVAGGEDDFEFDTAESIAESMDLIGHEKLIERMRR